MINIPNYEKIEEKNSDSSFERIKLGYQECVVMNSSTQLSKSGSSMLVLDLDINSGDNKGYYTRDYQNNNNPNKQWRCKYYIGYDEQNPNAECNKYFKGAMTSFEKSNPGYKFNGDERGLINRVVGTEFIQEEYEGQDGKIHLRTKVDKLRSTVSDHSKIRERVRLLDGKYMDFSEYMENRNPIRTAIQIEPEINTDELPF